MNAGQLSAGTVFEVKCLFAIDAIAAVYRGESPRFENGSCASVLELESVIDRADGTRLRRFNGVGPAKS